MKEAPGSSETSVLTRATRRNNPEDTILHHKLMFIFHAKRNFMDQNQQNICNMKDLTTEMMWLLYMAASVV
jgi:hypothetical protein